MPRTPSDASAAAKRAAARTGFRRLAQIGEWSIYQGTHSDERIRLSFEVITWPASEYVPLRWHAELMLRNDPADATLKHRVPFGEQLDAAEILAKRVDAYGRLDDRSFGPTCSVHAVGDTEREALDALQSLLERASRALANGATDATH